MLIQTSSADTAPAPNPEPRPLLLLVEDDEATTLLLTATLERDGFDVVAFGSAEEAQVHLATGARPDVVLSDLLLPGDDGVALCQWIRMNHADPLLPVLLLSSAAERANRLRALDQGADDILSKPVDPVELRARVQSLARLGRARARVAARDRIDNVLSEVSDGVVLLHADGTVREANVRARALLGLSATFAGDLLADVTSRFEVAEDAGKVPDSDGRRRILFHRPRTDKEQDLWLELLLVPLTADRGEGHAVVVRDVTQERRASELADVVLSSIAHKLRTPLTGIVSVAAGLERMVEGPAGQLVGIIQRSAARLDDSLGRILDHASAVASGEGDTSVLLRPGTCANVLRNLVGPTSEPTVERLTECLQEPVLVPMRPLVAAIDEFVANAIAAGDPLPRLYLSQVGPDLVARVADEGHGFPHEDAGRIFSPFLQVDRTGQDTGMGLGLALVQHLAARVGGNASASSQQHGTTAFEVRLPSATRGASSPVGGHAVVDRSPRSGLIAA